MKRKTRRMTAWMLACCIGVSALSSGCSIHNWLGIFGPNFSINLVIPLGLNGNPGLLNPFGIVQALVNGTLGLVASNGGTNGTGGTGAGGNTNVPPTVL